MISLSKPPPIPYASVLYLLDHAEMGGGETSFLFFMEELARTAPWLKPVVAMAARGPLRDALLERGVEVHEIAYPRFFRRGPLPWIGFKSVAAIARLIRRTNARLVHANNLFGMMYGGMAARRRGVPMVWTCHGWYEVDNGIKSWLAQRYPAHIACVSEAVREAVLRQAPAQKTSIDYLGAPAFESPRPTHEIRADVRAELGIGSAKLAAAIGHFRPVKGQQYLIEALPRVVEAAPDLILLLIGDAFPNDPVETEHKQRVQRRIEELGLRERVRMLGFRKDARRLLRGLDLLVIPSERETFSMVAVEGLEAGIPVLGPDGDGPREIIEAPGCGLRFEPKNVADLADKMIRLLNDPSGCGFDAAAGPRRFHELFTVQAHVRRTLALYSQLVPELAAPPPPRHPDPA